MQAQRAAARPPVAVRALDRERTATLVALVVITTVAAALRFALFTKVQANPFYDAAVRSMGQSWHNFFFGAFEPGAQVSIDKAPVDLWLQVVSTKLLGFSSTALRLPEAIAGTLAVPLLFDTVRRMFGRLAGLASAAVMAVLPVAVITARSDTMDSLMMLLLVGAAWLIVRASQTRRAAPLIGAGAVIGLAFNVKLFEALIALPALVVLAVLASTLPWRRLVAQLAAAGAAFIGTALSWVTAASLLPGSHPWPIGSTNGGVWNVLFVFNGLDRLRVGPTQALAALDPAGPWRLFAVNGAQHGLLVGSALVAALLVGAAALVYAGPRLWRERSTQGRMRFAGASSITLWLVLGVALFSHMGRLHSRYLEAMSPAIAAATGVGLATLARAAGRDLRAGVLLALASTLSAVAAIVVGSPPPAAAAAALGGALAALLALVMLLPPNPVPRGRAVSLLAAGALTAVLAVPFAASVHVVARGSSDSGRPGAMPNGQVSALSSYLRLHQGSARYQLASSSVAKAGPLIARDGRPVLMLTSLYDRPLLTPAQLETAVTVGQVRYVLLGRGTCSARSGHVCSPVVRWARAHASDVSVAAGLPTPGLLYHFAGARS